MLDAREGKAKEVDGMMSPARSVLARKVFGADANYTEIKKKYAFFPLCVFRSFAWGLLFYLGGNHFSKVKTSNISWSEITFEKENPYRFWYSTGSY